MWLGCVGWVVVVAVGGVVAPADGRYHDHEAMGGLLGELSRNYSELASVYSIGRSVEGRELWVLRVRAPESPLVGAPNVKFVGNIHGNEPVGRELILRFAEYVLRNYESDAEVRWVLERTVLHLLPSLNPDGFERSREGACQSGPGRENGNQVDLNRSFPDQWRENRVSVQPETLAVARWMSEVTFVLSGSFHGGALVANYPFDSPPGNGTDSLVEEILRNMSRGANLMDIWRDLAPEERDTLLPDAAPTPDDDVFRHLAQVYSSTHPHMHKARTCKDTQPAFPGGITNGAAWYSFTGGMQDFNYVSRGCMELTLEVSCCKYPEGSSLGRLWGENRRAMLELAKQAQRGVRGVIADKATSAHIPGAVLRVSGRDIPFTSSRDGEFWRILLPGEYTLSVEARGYEAQSFPFAVETSNSSHPTPTWLNIFLQPTLDRTPSASSSTAPRAPRAPSSPATALLPLLLTTWTVT